MKTNLLLIGVVSLSAFAFGGCAYRDANMWVADTGKVFGAKNPDIMACYDGVLKTTPTAAGKVTVAFEVETEEGKIQTVTVDKPNTTAPDAVSECVTKNINNLAVTPPDKRLGQGKWTWEFAPNPPKT